VGLERLIAAGEMTADEVALTLTLTLTLTPTPTPVSPQVASLLSSGLPPSQYAYVLMEWAGMYATRAMQARTLHPYPYPLHLPLPLPLPLPLT